MNRKLKTTTLLVTIFCVALSVAVAAFVVQIDPSPTTLYVDPTTIADPTILPGATIPTRIMIDDIADMKTCSFNLTFNPTVLAVVRIMKQQVGGQFPTLNMEGSDVGGYLKITLTYGTTVTVSTPTALVEIEFFVKDYGRSLLHFDASTLTEGHGAPIPHETQDGLVHIFIRNIVVDSISVPTTETHVGSLIPISTVVVNDGDIPENFSVTIYYDSTAIGTQDVTDLGAKENVTILFVWDTSTVSPSMTPYTIRAAATTVPHETNTTDNLLIDGTVKLKLIGDVNGDGAVNIDDLIVWDAAFGTRPGDPNWNVQADINMDDVVNEADATLILDHYQETL